MKTAIIAGGAGFIGTNLSISLLERGYRVISLDNFFSGSRENIEYLSKKDGFSFIEHDIREPFLLESGIQIDEIYNLACPASPDYYQSDPLLTLETNFLGTKNLLEIAKKYNSKFLQSSTSEVYGDPLENPQRETYRGNVNTYGPRACYDEGKRVAETLCYEYRRLFGVDTKIIRIFNTYGPFMRLNDGRIITNTLKSILEGSDILVYGNGSQTRSFQYISDLIAGIKVVMESSDGSPINIGNPKEYTILDTVKLIQETLEVSGTISFKGLPKDDPTQRRPDITKLTALGWTPLIPLEVGVQKTYEYFKKNENGYYRSN